MKTDKKIERLIEKNNISKEGLKLVLITKKSLFQKIFTFYIGFLGIMGIIVCFFSVLQGQQPEFLNLETILLFIFLTVLFAFNFSGSPVIYFYNDGFIVGKDKEKILYKNFEYYYTPGLSEGNIHRICYKTEKNECKSLSLQSLAKGTRKILIKDYLNYIIAEKINRVEEGYEEKFVVKRDIKSIFELMIGILSFFVIIGPAVDKIFSDCPGNIYENPSGTYEISLTKDYIKIKDVIYNRNENKMFFNKWNNFIISDLEGKILQQIYFNNITRPDLFLNLINHFFTEKEDLQQ